MSRRAPASRPPSSSMIDELTYHYAGFALHSGIIVQHGDMPPPETAEATAAKLSSFILAGFEQDIGIWRDKTRVDDPLPCEEDGPVYRLRRWYEQFYVDVADVRPEMTDRFEFEIDTTRPVESWQREAEGNLTRRDGART